jgi:squalene synthase HpnC
MPATPPATDRVVAAYQHCWHIATTHYENFTVGSWLLPKRLRRHIAAIYAFARTADDFADEGGASSAERLAQLHAWGAALEACFAGHVTDPVFIALAHTVRTFDLPIEPFQALLRAFERDAAFRPFATFAELEAYCRDSADPVGHLILLLFGYRDRVRQALADQVCSGLQLANFWQDLAIDVARGRVYVPAEDLERFGCTADDLHRGVMDDCLRALMRFEVARARARLLAGLRLADQVERRLAREVLLFAWGGLAIVAAIERADFDVFAHRPTLSPTTKLGLVLRALASRRRAARAAPSLREAT